jgi:hypothetical protein
MEPLEVTLLFIMQRAFGGGEGLRGIFGTLSRKSTVSVFHYMNRLKRLKNSHFVDAGAGLHG